MNTGKLPSQARMHAGEGSRNGSTNGHAPPRRSDRERLEPPQRRPATDHAVSRFLSSAILDQVARERAIPPAAPVAVNGATHADFSPMDHSATIAFAGSGNAPSAPSVSFPLWKRTLDCLLILLSCVFWLPVMLLIMAGIKLSSPGPVFFRQERIGLGGRRFLLAKFRTMQVNVETRLHESHLDRLIEADCPMTKLDSSGDPRLIRGGRFLRATGLDELPQLFNILRGDMSLVGPRPCTLHEFERYQPWQRARINAPPGLTGYWQVNGKNKTTFSEMITMDIYYGQHMSVLRDLGIIFKTIPTVISQTLESRGTAWRLPGFHSGGRK